MTRAAFENAIVVASAIGASSNCPPHLVAIARHMGVELSTEDWQAIGHEIPLLVDCQPVGGHLGEGFHRAGGVPAVMKELLAAGKLRGGALTVTGQSVAENLERLPTGDRTVIREYARPMKERAGYLVMSGNLFDSAVMKVSAIDDDFRKRYLSNPADPEAFEARAIVFEGPEDYHDRINDPTLAIDASCVLFIRNTGTVGYPGSAEVVNMQPPDALIREGITSLPTIGDGRQSGTSASPSILNASPEAAVGGGLALLKTNDRVRVDLNQRTRQRADPGRGARGAPRGLDAAGARAPDAVAGDLPQDGRPALDGRLPGGGDAVSRHRQRAREPAAFALSAGGARA